MAAGACDSAGERALRRRRHHGEQLSDGVVAVLRRAAVLVHGLDQLAIPAVPEPLLDRDVAPLRAHPRGLARGRAALRGGLEDAALAEPAHRVEGALDGAAGGEVSPDVAAEEVGGVLDDVSVQLAAHAVAARVAQHLLHMPERRLAPDALPVGVVLHVDAVRGLADLLLLADDPA